MSALAQLLCTIMSRTNTVGQVVAGMLSVTIATGCAARRGSDGARQEWMYPNDPAGPLQRVAPDISPERVVAAEMWDIRGQELIAHFDQAQARELFNEFPGFKSLRHNAVAGTYFSWTIVFVLNDGSRPALVTDGGLYDDGLGHKLVRNEKRLAELLSPHVTSWLQRRQGPHAAATTRAAE